MLCWWMSKSLVKKFEKTKESEDQDRKILDFFNFVIEDVKKGLIE